METKGFPKQYRYISECNPNEDCTIFLGLVVQGVLDVRLLGEKAAELISHWPVLGGQQIRMTSSFSFTTGTTVDFESRHIASQLNDVLQIDVSLTTKATKEPSYRSFKTNSSGASGDDLLHFNSGPSPNSEPEHIFVIRVTTLRDATLLGFRVTHALCDAQALYEAIKAYRDLVTGSKIPEVALSPAITTRLSTLIQGDDHLSERISTNIKLYDPFTVLSQEARGTVWLDKQSELSQQVTSRELHIHLNSEVIEGWWDECQREIDEAVSLGALQEAVGIKLTKNDILTA